MVRKKSTPKKLSPEARARKNEKARAVRVEAVAAAERAAKADAQKKRRTSVGSGRGGKARTSPGAPATGSRRTTPTSKPKTPARGSVDFSRKEREGFQRLLKKLL